MLSGMGPTGRIKQPVPRVQLPQATPSPGTTTGAPALNQGLPMQPILQRSAAQPLSASAPLAGVKLAGVAMEQAQSAYMGNIHRAGGELGMALASLCASCTDSADLVGVPGLNLGVQAGNMGDNTHGGVPVFDKSGGVGGVGDREAPRIAPASLPPLPLYTSVHLHRRPPSLPSWQLPDHSSPRGWSSAPTAVSRRRRWWRCWRSGPSNSTSPASIPLTSTDRSRSACTPRMCVRCRLNRCTSPVRRTRYLAAFRPVS